MNKPPKNILWLFVIFVLLLGCNKSHSPNLRTTDNGLLIFGAEGDSLQLVGHATDSLSNLLKEQGLFESDNLWFTIGYPAQKEIPPPPSSEEVEQIEPYYTISIGTSELKRQEYLELEKQRQQPIKQNRKIEVDYNFWDFWIVVSEAKDSILTVSNQ